MSDTTPLQPSMHSVHKLFDFGRTTCIAFSPTPQLPILSASGSILNILGVDEKALLAGQKYVTDWIHPEDVQAYVNELHDYIDQPEIDHFEKNDFRIIGQNRQTEWIREQAYVNRNAKGDVECISVCWHLVTEEYRLRQKLDEMSNNLDIVQASMNAGFFEYYFGTETVYYSDELKRILGFEPHELDHHFSEWEKRTPSQYVDSALKLLDSHLQGKTEWFETAFPMRHKQGHQLWILARGKAQKNAQGYPYKLVASFKEFSAITDESLTSDIVNQLPMNAGEEDTFEQVFMQAPIGMALIDPNGIVVNINPKFMDMLGYHPSEARGRSISQFLHPDERQGAFHNFEQLFNGERPVTTSVRRVFDKSGRVRYIELSSFIITTQVGEKLLCASATDATLEEKNNEIQRNLDHLIQQSEASDPTQSPDTASS